MIETDARTRNGEVTLDDEGTFCSILEASNLTIRSEIREAIERVVESQHFILGPEVEALEREMAAF